MLPEERTPHDLPREWGDVERLWACRACWWSPALGATAWLIAARYLLVAVYLQSAEWKWKPALAVGILVFFLPWLWLAGLQWQRRWWNGWHASIPVAAILAAGFVIAANIPWQIAPVRWFFVEWAKVRTSNPSFARNTLFWEQRNFESAGIAREPNHRLGLVGSSQVYQGFDLQKLANDLPGWSVEKACLAGFGPLQYALLQDRLDEREFHVVVTIWSEFDIFRDDIVPTNRLRWGSSPSGVFRVARAVKTPALLWENRSEFADLEFAAWVPVWRERDHLRRVLFGYWWNVSQPTTSPDARPILAESSGLAEALNHLHQHVYRTKLVDANFRALAGFAQSLRAHRTKLVVLEGVLHPAASAVYDQEFRRETRQRLQDLAAQEQFHYISAADLPEFTTTEFADAYHVNELGRARMSAVLARYLTEHRIITTEE